MNEADLRAVLREYVGGSVQRYRHPMNPRFVYTAGVRAMAQRAGAYWLLDIVATEVFEQSTKRGEHALLKYYVNGTTGLLELTFDDAEQNPWRKLIHSTDFPEGTWVFEVVPEWDDDRTVVVMSLIEEH